MVQGHKILVHLTVSSHKYAKIIVPQILSQECVDSLVLLVSSDDSYTKGYLQTVSIEHGSKVQIVHLNKSQPADSSVLEYFKSKKFHKDDVCVYFASQICFIAPDCIEELSKFAIDNPEYELVYPAAVNTERTTYIFQVTSHLKPRLLWRWDTAYLDEFSFKNTQPSFHIEAHESFLKEASEDGLDCFKFGVYTLSGTEVVPNHAFAMMGEVSNSHFKLKYNFFRSDKHFLSAITGKALCSWFANPVHKKSLDNTDLLSKYQDLGQAVYLNTEQDSNKVNDDISEVDTGFHLSAFLNKKKESFDIKFAISSHVSTQKKTLPVLLKSMVEANIDKENILVVVGGAEEQHIERKNGILYSYVTHNSFDHNSIIDVVEKDWGGEWWFFLHDTTKAGLKFKEKLLKIGPKANHVAALKDGWLNMGLFSQDALRSMKNYILQLKNCNKMQAILSEKLYTRMSDYTYYDIVEQINFPYYGDIYGDGIDRQVMHMPTIDLYKFQSFHYHSEATKKVIDEWVIK